MMRMINHADRRSSFKLATVCLATALLAGCQPEGTGSVKGPSQRADDSSLGRPFGNNPEVPKKKPAAEPAKGDVPKSENSRL